MNREKAYEWAIELASEPCSLAVQRSAYALCKDPATLHRHIASARQGRTGKKALAQYLMSQQPISLAEADVIDEAAWQGALSHACHLCGRFRTQPYLEALLEIYGETMARQVRALAERGRTDEAALKELVQLLYRYRTGRTEAPSMEAIDNVPGWLTAMQQAQELAKLSQEAVPNWLTKHFPKIPRTKATGLTELAAVAYDDPSARKLLTIELYKLIQTKKPVEIPDGYYSSAEVKLAEARTEVEGYFRAADQLNAQIAKMRRH